MGIPSFKTVGADAIASAMYAFLGKRLTDYVIARVIHSRKMEGEFVGKLVLLPVGESLARKFILKMDSPSLGSLFLKALVATGTQMVVRRYIM